MFPSSDWQDRPARATAEIAIILVNERLPEGVALKTTLYLTKIYAKRKICISFDHQLNPAMLDRR